MVLDTFEKSVKMSTYLVAWVVSDYAKISQTTKSGKIVCIHFEFEVSKIISLIFKLLEEICIETK